MSTRASDVVRHAAWWVLLSFVFVLALRYCHTMLDTGAARHLGHARGSALHLHPQL